MSKVSRKDDKNIMHEIEVKVLEVDPGTLAQTLQALGAKKILETKLTVDWYGPKGLTHRGDDPWFLRIRSYTDGTHEVTWKGKSKKLGTARKHKEINFFISDPVKLAELFTEIGLEKYAHQEKFRTSWTLEDWRFDLDQYPDMPAYLEIEGTDDAHIRQGLERLDLQGHKNSAEGEKVLIETEYGLNWYDMRFDQ